MQRAMMMQNDEENMGMMMDGDNMMGMMEGEGGEIE